MNTSYKYLIIGGGAAGVSAAETIRQNDQAGSLAIISDEEHPMYSRVMLSKPNFFLGKIPFGQIYLKGMEWYSDNKIDFIGGKKASELDATNKSVSLSDGSKISYGKLLIATGVEARKWSVPGADKKGIHYLRSLADGMAIMEHIKKAKSALTIGGGFISFEMADLLKMAGIDTSMILRESYFWEPILDERSGLMIENAMTKGGVKLIKNAEVKEVIGGENVGGVILNRAPAIQGAHINNGSPIEADNENPGSFPKKLPCDMIVCGIGVVNPVSWLKDSVATNRGILADEYLKTNAPDVWTAGDIAEYNDLLLEEHVQMGNWVNAREQGRIAGLNMSLEHKPFKFVSFYTTQGFGISIAFVGDVSPESDRTVIPRGSPEMNSYARIIIRNGEIEGATMINRTGEMASISKLIETNMKVAGKEKELGDADYDLKKLVG